MCTRKQTHGFNKWLDGLQKLVYDYDDLFDYEEPGVLLGAVWTINRDKTIPYVIQLDENEVCVICYRTDGISSNFFPHMKENEARALKDALLYVYEKTHECKKCKKTGEEK